MESFGKSSNVSDVAEGLTRFLTGKSVYLCIGTEKVAADSLGPKVGKKLNDKMERPAYVYGTIGANVTAQNVTKTYEMVRNLHPDSTVVVIDAGVGEAEQVGEIQVDGKGIVPGAATGKNLAPTGHVSVVGVVSERDLDKFYEESDEKNSVVERLAEKIVQAIVLAQRV